MNHAVVIEDRNAVLQEFIKKLFFHHERLYINCYQLYSSDESWYEESVKKDKLTAALYYTSLEDLINIIKNIIFWKIKINIQSKYFNNALQTAFYEEHEKIV